MGTVSFVKEFPWFDRGLFLQPEKLFQGWTYDDFISFGRNNFKVIDGSTYLKSLPGWCVESDGEKFGWRFTFNIDNKGHYPQLNIKPDVSNKALFPYEIKIHFGNVDFRMYEHCYNIHSIGSNYFYPYDLIQKAMNNHILSLDKALLLEAFLGVSLISGVRSPIISRGPERNHILKDLVDVSVPFEILKETFFVLSGKFDAEMFTPCVNLINLAEHVHKRGVGQVERVPSVR